MGELPGDFPLPPDYNIAPTTFQPVIRESRESNDREVVLMRWGLIPYFAKSLADFKGIPTINARAESIEKSPTWRTPFQRRRCLMPTDGFSAPQGLHALAEQESDLEAADRSVAAFRVRRDEGVPLQSARRQRPEQWPGDAQ